MADFSSLPQFQKLGYIPEKKPDFWNSDSEQQSTGVAFLDYLAFY